MKKIFLLAAIISTLFISCGKDPESFDKSLLKGLWILEEVNDSRAYTDEIFVTEFTNRKQILSKLYPHPYGGTLWATSDDCTYYFDNEENIIIEGKNAEKKKTYLKASISELDNNSLTYTVIEMTIEDKTVEGQIGQKYSFYKSNCEIDLIGKWKIEDSEGRAHQREFFEDGTYSIINANEGIDRRGEYYLHGDFLTMNNVTFLLINDNPPYYFCDRWEMIPINDDYLEIEVYGRNGTVSTLTFTRVIE